MLHLDESGAQGTLCDTQPVSSFRLANHAVDEFPSNRANMGASLEADPARLKPGTYILENAPISCRA